MSSGFYDPCRKRRLVESIETSGLTEYTWRWRLANWTCEISASVPSVSILPDRNNILQTPHCLNPDSSRRKKKTPKNPRLKKTKTNKYLIHLVLTMPNTLISTGETALGWKSYTPPPPPMLDEDEIKEFPCQLKFPNTLILKYQDVSDLSGKAEHLRLACEH